MSSQNSQKRILDNFIVIWLDSNINEYDTDTQYSINQLQNVVNSFERFVDPEQCIDYLTDIKNVKVFMIVSGSLEQQFVTLIQDIPQLYAIYVLCVHSTAHGRWIKDYHKLKGIFSEMKPLCDRLSRDIRETDTNWTSISVVSEASLIDRNQLDQSFMYLQLLKEIILKMQYNEKAKEEFVEFCLEQYIDNESTIAVIGEFEQDYERPSPIWWYTRDCFIYSMLNKALRTQDIDIIIKMGFFLRDLHRHIEHLHSNIDKRTRLIVYRGQGMFNVEFEKIIKSEGGLLSFNNFLSTTTDREVAYVRADSSRDNPELTGNFFQMEIDPAISSTPFASLDDVSYFSDSEKEILFSMHTVFRIIEMKKLDDRRLWQVKLTLTSDNDEQLKCLTDYIRKEFEEQPEWAKLGHLTLRMGEFDKAEEIFRENLQSPTNSDSIDNACLHARLGVIISAKGDQNIALSHLTKALEIFQKHFPLDHPCLIKIEAQIGGVLWLLGEYPAALSHLTKELEISQKLFPPDDPQLAVSHNNIATLYQAMGDSQTALLHLEKTLDIQQKSLPLNHPNLAGTHNNIGDLFRSMGSYPTARVHFEKALEIQQKTLPHNHPDLALSHTNIAELYFVQR